MLLAAVSKWSFQLILHRLHRAIASCTWSCSIALIGTQAGACVPRRLECSDTARGLMAGLGLGGCHA